MIFLKNYEKYETNEDLARTYILNHTLHTVETDDLYHDILGFLEWLKEETTTLGDLSSEPIPCPFCGANAVVDLTDRGFSVRCLECYTKSYPQFMKEDAISLWNRRASITPSPD